MGLRAFQNSKNFLEPYMAGHDSRNIRKCSLEGMFCIHGCGKPRGPGDPCVLRSSIPLPGKKNAFVRVGQVSK